MVASPTRQESQDFGLHNYMYALVLTACSLCLYIDSIATFTVENGRLCDDVISSSSHSEMMLWNPSIGTEILSQLAPPPHLEQDGKRATASDIHPCSVQHI